MRVRWLWLLLLLLIPVLIMPAAALEGWLYYRDITISNSLDQELTDYQVKIVLDTYSLILGGKMRSDCGDIRFTDAGENLLPYWVEPGTCNSQNTVIWVKVPSIRPSQAGTHVIRVVADSEDEFVELNEFNNTATASVSVSSSQAPPVPSPDGGVFPYPTPPPVGGKTFREIYEPLTLRTYNLPLEAMSLIAVLGISVVGYGFGVFRGTVNFFFLSVIYFIVSTFLGWSMFIAAGLLAVATMLLVVTVAFIRED